MSSNSIKHHLFENNDFPAILDGMYDGGLNFKNNNSEQKHARHMYPPVIPHSNCKSHDFASAFVIVIEAFLIVVEGLSFLCLFSGG